MPSAVTTDQKTDLRSRGHWSELFAAFLVPPVVYTARLAAVPASADMVAVITYTSGVGTLGNVREGMTLYIGSSAGAYDLGMVRIRKAPIAGTFYIGEQSKVTWQADAYLTVVEDFDLWVRHVAMDGTTPKMDYDIAYSDQHSSFKPVPVLGPHRVAKLTGATVQVTLGPETGVNSWVFGSTISSYSWTVPGAVSLSSASAQRPVATFDETGWHACYCTVTAANGKTKTGMRWVYIWDDDNMPARVFSLENLSEDYNTGGGSCTVVMADEADLTEVRERTLCILFAQDYIDNEAVTMGQVEHCENIRFVGRVGDEDFEYDPDAGTVSFEVMGYQYWFSKIAAFPVGVEIAKNTPAVWTSLAGLTVDRGLWHLLEWRSTATIIMDFFRTSDTRYSPEVAAYAGNLWEQMEEFIHSQILGHVHVDMFGRLYAEIDPQIVPEADRTGIVTVMDLEKQDFQAGIRLDKQVVSDVSMVDVSGIYIDQYGGGALSFFALSPGHVFGDHGSVEIVDRLLLASQAQCNQIAGLLYGQKANKYKGLSGKLTSHNFMVSCFPRQYVTFTVESTDTPRGETVQRNWIPRRRTLGFSSETGAWEIELELEAESFEENSVAYVPPSGDDISIPPLPPLPPLPDYLPIYPGDTSDKSTGPSTVVAVIKNTLDGQPGGVIYTTNFNAASASDIVWQFWNNGLTAGDILALKHKNSAWEFALFRTPIGSYWLLIPDAYGYGNSVHEDNGGLYYAPALGATWTRVFGAAELAEEYPTVGSGYLWIGGVTYNPNQLEEIALLGGSNYPGGGQHIYLGNRNGFVKKAAFSLSVNLWGGRANCDGQKWVFTQAAAASSSNWRIARFSIDCTTEENAQTVGYGSEFPKCVFRAGTGELLYFFGTYAKKAFVSDDYGDTITEIGDSKLEYDSYQDGTHRCDLTGQYLLGMWDTTGRRGKSGDFGTTWSALSNLVYGSAYKFAYAGGIGVNSQWIAGYATIYFSADVFGSETWESRDGNLAYLMSAGKVFRRIIVPGVMDQ